MGFDIPHQERVEVYMDIYIDCEFNGFGGELISLALVAADGKEFYGVLEISQPYDSWVAEHVVPILNREPESYESFQKRLEEFLTYYSLQGFTLIADWPDDIKYFMQSIITGPGYMMNIPSFNCRMDRSLSSEASKVPHNALEDARAIREANLAQ